FTAHNINILRAELSVSKLGSALHTFYVTDANGLLISDVDVWEGVSRDLREVLSGRARIENLVAEKFRPSFFKRKVAQRLPSRVDIDNDVSAYYTVIDIYAQDRVGLLYQVTSTLTALGLYVDVSKISTKVDQVADTFYVKDIFGHKITDGNRLKRVREVLMDVLEKEPTPEWRVPL
ncbi:MAG: [protein-PII] uridylyltransferase, partial [Deltaproteobacteria bacterium]|nr:[protein-PII] uridylyltransferase [Deltaproteobacteria bacterium]